MHASIYYYTASIPSPQNSVPAARVPPVMHCRLRLKPRAEHRDSRSKRKIEEYVSVQMRVESAGGKEGKSRPGT